MITGPNASGLSLSTEDFHVARAVAMLSFPLRDTPPDAEGRLPEGLVMRDIAAEIGATPEATYRALADLVRQGRMLRDGRARFRVPVSDHRDDGEKTS